MLVVGGGAVGLAVGAMCVRAGVPRVQVVERGRLACGASGSAAGGLAPGTHAWTRPDPFLRLGSASLALHRELDAEWGYGLRNLDWKLSPTVVVKDQACIDPLNFACALASRAGRVSTGVEVLAVDGPRVVTSHGAITPAAVVFATGTEPRVAGLRPLGIASSVLKGHLIATEPAPFTLDPFLAARGILVLQAADGRLVAGGTHEPDDAEPVVRPDVVERIVSTLHWLLPESRSLDVTHAWCCLRPSSLDELPVIDRYPGLDNAWVTAGHLRTGLLMAPATGRAIASWITTGVRPDEIAAFSLERFQ